MLRYLVTAAVLLPVGALAQADDPLARCDRIANGAQRLACYDAVRAVERQAPAQARPRAAAPAQPAPSAGTPRRLMAGVVSYKFDSNGKFTVTLDNGQVWRQEKADNGRAQFDRKRRNVVVITPGFWGSHNLTLNNMNARFKVDRIKPRAD